MLIPAFLDSEPALFFFLTLTTTLLLCTIIASTNANLADSFLLLPTASLGILFYGLRGTGAPDTPIYLEAFYSLGSSSDFPFSYSLYWLMRAIKLIGSDETTYLLGTSAALIASLVTSICLLAPKPYRSLCLTFFLMSWGFFDMASNAYRQGISGTFCLISLGFFLRNRKTMAFLIFVIAAGFHWTAPIFALAALLARKLQSQKNAALAIFSFSALYLTASIIINTPLTNLILAGLDAIENASGTFAGINPNDKIRFYLENKFSQEVPMFYEYPIIKRAYYLIEVLLITLLVTIASFYQKPPANRGLMPSSQVEALALRKTIFLTYSILCIYATTLLSMPFFFRNFYWPVLLSPIVACLALNGATHRYRAAFTGAFSLIYLAISTLSLWRAPILRMHY